jgi:hypothetical protein
MAQASSMLRIWLLRATLKTPGRQRSGSGKPELFLEEAEFDFSKRIHRLFYSNLNVRQTQLGIYPAWIICVRDSDILKPYQFNCPPASFNTRIVYEFSKIRIGHQFGYDRRLNR